MQKRESEFRERARALLTEYADIGTTAQLLGIFVDEAVAKRAGKTDPGLRKRISDAIDKASDERLTQPSLRPPNG